MKKEKHVSLSNKSLAKVWAWCEANPGDLLSDAYMAACGTCGAIDREEGISGMIKAGRGDDDFNYIREWCKAYDAAFTCRDTIGRVILNSLKRLESAKKPINNFPTDASEPA